LTGVSGVVAGIGCGSQPCAELLGGCRIERGLEEEPEMLVTWRGLDCEAHWYGRRPCFALVGVRINHQGEHGDGVLEPATLLGAKPAPYCASFDVDVVTRLACADGLAGRALDQIRIVERIAINGPHIFGEWVNENYLQDAGGAQMLGCGLRLCCDRDKELAYLTAVGLGEVRRFTWRRIGALGSLVLVLRLSGINWEIGLLWLGQARSYACGFFFGEFAVSLEARKIDPELFVEYVDGAASQLLCALVRLD